MSIPIRKLLAVTALVVGTVLLSASGASADHDAVKTGDLFDFAEQTDSDSPHTSAPAFPSGPGAKAWWAGVCDLTDTGPGGFAVGAHPDLLRFPNCIDHPISRPTSGLGSDQMQPPLSVGRTTGTSTPDGWIRQVTQVPGGPSWRLSDIDLAGAHPDGSASFWFSRDAHFTTGNTPNTNDGPDGAPRSVRVSIPPGVIGDPTAIPKCPSSALNTAPATCPPQSQIGVSTISLGGHTAVFPVYNVEPRDGKTAELIISGAGLSSAYQTNAPVIAEARTDGDFGIDAFAGEIPSPVAIHSQTFTIWGVPWARSHDPYRPVAGYCSGSGASDPFGGNAWQTPGLAVPGLAGGTSAGCSQNPVSYHPSWGPIKPFLTTQTECSEQRPVTKIAATNYHTDVVARADSIAPEVEGCGDIEFDTKSAFSLASTSTAADGATGLDVDLSVAQNTVAPLAKRFNPCDVVGPTCTVADVSNSAVAHWKSPAGLATSHLDQTIVDLPPGVAVNPSGATGLQGCSEAQIGLTQAGNPSLFNDHDPFDGDNAGGVECPQGSIIGEVEVKTHLLDETLTGQMVLGQPQPQDIGRSDQGLTTRLYLVVRNRMRGIVAKVFGTATTDPVTGRISANFDQNPRVPFDSLKVKVKGGERGMLALPQKCGSADWRTEMRPYSGNAPAIDEGAFTTDSNCAYGFAPALRAGLADPTAGRYGSQFAFTFSRKDGEQWFRGLTAKLPPGLIAKVRGVQLCTDAQAAAGACPAASRIGTVDAAAGSGTPFVLERKGDAYLTEGYKGGEYGLMVRVPVEAGPFRGNVALAPIVVRQAIHVNRKTAQVTAISDPFPKIWHGVPLRVREVNVLVNRPNFMLNPSDCEPKRVEADIVSVEGTVASLSDPFQVSGCAALPFKPKLALRLTGRKQVRTGKHPGIRAQVNQTGIGEAGIERAEVRLPKSLALDVDNAQALCEFEDGTKDDLENHCPKGSIVGRARAVSPLLNDPLAGNVYFVKNIRRDPKTGNVIRTLPMIIAALRGEIAINLVGTSDVKGGKLVSTFDEVPDAPVERFNLNINGGKNGILAVTRTRRSRINLCSKPKSHVAEADFDGHNGKRHDRDITMKTPCSKRQVKNAKRAAKRAAKQARKARR